jgi:methionyl-tRNA formyltransferase
MLLEEGLDTGPILLQQTVEIGPDETAVDLFESLAHEGAPLVVETLAGLAAGTIHPQQQNHSFATFAPILNREDGRMDFVRRSSRELYNRWRGFQPWPGAFTTLDGKKLIVHRMAPVEAVDLSIDAVVLPGQVHIVKDRLLAACAGESWLELLEVQLEGKKRMSAAEFLRGTTLVEGARFGELAS